jgi:glycosyltransferase involved in cell wall biosynthesis
MPKLRVVHVINSFEFGGAEAMLCNLLVRTDRARFEPSVVALIDDLSVAGPVRDAGIPITTMGMRPGLPDPRGVWRLARHLRRVRPDVVQTWMDHSNLIGGLAARFAPGAKVVWGIHHGDHVPGVAKRTTLMTVAACARVSSWVPARIVCCSQHARTLYAERGFDSDKLTVIPNGFDSSRFRPDPAARDEVRREIGVAPDAPLIGLVARYDPFKDHATFLRAAAAFVRTSPDARFLLCGNRVDAGNAELVEQIASLGLAEHVHLLGPRRDVQRIYAALDVLAQSSISEAFPLVLGEAMASGVPCAATDVGDSALIVGDTGRIVPPRNPEALAGAWADLLAIGTTGRQALGRAARQRVVERFDLGAVTRRYEDLYARLAAADEHVGMFAEPTAATWSDPAAAAPALQPE